MHLCSISLLFRRRWDGSGNSSYEIFAFGGTTGADDSATTTILQKVYILTLPTFHWIEAPAVTSQWRAYRTCSVIGNCQMISIGGAPWAANDPLPWSDPWGNRMQIPDMTDLVWTDYYNASAAAYQTPDLVKEYYASNSRYPQSWVDPKLAEIFKEPNATTSTSTSTGEKSNTREIASGVIGGIAVLSAIVGFAFWFTKRMQNRRYSPASTTSTEPSTQFRDVSDRKDTCSGIGWLEGSSRVVGPKEVSA